MNCQARQLGQAVSAAEDPELYAVLEEILARTAGITCAIASLHMAPIRNPHVFPARMITVRLTDDSEHSFFQKVLSEAEKDHPDKTCRERELRIYRELFTDPVLPVPRFLGLFKRPAGPGPELYLEPFDGAPLNEMAMEHWFTAVRRLADLHAHFGARRRQLAGSDFLLRLDDGYLAAWARRAQAVARPWPIGLAARLEAVLDEYPRVIGPLVDSPSTLVHNDLAPQNVLVDPRQNPARVCFLDWELAGVGCGLLDLAHLTYGFDARRAAELTAAYRTALANRGADAGGDGPWHRALTAARIHKQIYRLARSEVRGANARQRQHWLAEAEVLLSQLRSGAEP